MLCRCLFIVSVLIMFAFEGISQNCDRLAILDNFPVIRSPTCGLVNGSIEIRASGNGSISYSLNGGNFQSSGLFENLDEFDHVITYRDSQNCSKTISIPLKGEDPIQVQSIQSNNASCNLNDGRITINAIGEELQYSIDGTNYQFNNVFSNLRPNRYNIFIKDVNDCIAKETIIITKGSILFERINITKSECGVNNGEIEVLATGNNLRYMLEGETSFTSTNVFQNLSPGAYSIIIEDAGGCTFNRSVVLEPDYQFSFQSTESSCSSATGEISVNVNSPGIYEYSIDGGAFQDSPIFSNLASGTHSIRFRNPINQECVIRRSVRVGEIVSVLNFTVSSMPTTCAANSGSISIRADGVGTITYTITKDLFTDTNTTGNFSNLEGGDYQVKATDENNCSIERSETVETSNDISANPTFETELSSCSEATGQIRISISSTSGNLQYSLNGGPFQSSNIINDVPGGINLIRVESGNGCFREFEVEVGETQNDISVSSLDVVAPTNRCSGDGRINITADGTGVEYSLDNVIFQPTGLFSNLDAGTYIVYMRNSLGCTRRTGEIELISTFSLIGFDFKPTNCLQNDGEVLIFANGEEVTYKVDDSPVQTSNNFTNLSPGIHSLTLTDINNCVIESNFEMPNIGFVDIQDIEITPSFCGEPNNQIIVFAVNENLNIEYSIDDQNYFSDSLFVDLPAGSLTVFARDEIGCKDSFNLTLPSSSIPKLDLKVNPSICGDNNGSIIIDHTEGVGDLLYSINQSPYSDNNTFVNLSPGNYTIDVQDSVGCFVSDTFEIVMNCEALFPNVITPNGNGQNDIFKINYYLPLQINNFRIYDRWGKNIYTASNFISTDISKWWNGNGRQQGSYLAYIEYEFEGEIFQKSTTFLVLY